MDGVLERANQRLQVARYILSQLQLLERWSHFGDPVIVGAMAYGLMVAPDIDLEVYCDDPKIESGFEVLKACAQHPRVRKARFSNRLDPPDMGLYWQLRYLHEDGEEWKVDMWSVRRDHPGPTSKELVVPIRQALTNQNRAIILGLKEQARLSPGSNCGSIYIYQAVLEDGVRTWEELRGWLERNPTEGLTAWQPGHGG